MDEQDDWPDDPGDPASVRFGDVVGPRDRFVFEYDFGDGREHVVVVEAVLLAAELSRPACLARSGGVTAAYRYGALAPDLKRGPERQ